MQLPKHIIILIVQPKPRVESANFTQRANTKQGCRVQRMNFSLRQARKPARQITYTPRPNAKRRKQPATMRELRDDGTNLSITFQPEREFPHLSEQIHWKLRILIESEHPAEAFAARKPECVIVSPRNAFVAGCGMVDDIRREIF